MRKTKLVAAWQLLGTLAVVAAVVATVETTRPSAAPGPDPGGFDAAGPEAIGPTPEATAYAASARAALAGRRIVEVTAQPGGDLYLVLDDGSGAACEAVAIVPAPGRRGE